MYNTRKQVFGIKMYGDVEKPVLRFLYHNRNLDGFSVRKIAISIGIKPDSVRGALIRLRDIRLVISRRSKEDARIKIWRIIRDPKVYLEVEKGIGINKISKIVEHSKKDKFKYNNRNDTQEEVMAKKKVFVSFDYDNDKHYKYLLEAWHANPEFEFTFADATPSEINSTNIGRIKAALTTKINNATHTLVIVGKEANKRHKDSELIGFKNWLNFEVHQSKMKPNKIAAVKIDRSYESPEELLAANASWAMSFTEAGIIKALNEA